MTALSAERRAVAGWVLYDFAAQPFFTLVTTFVFAPYFVAHVVGDEARGQALWGLAVAIAGLTIALSAPVLGAVADRTGPRKPWIAGATLLTAAGSALLWFAAPGAESLVPLVLAAFVVATVGAEAAIVFTNAMMPSIAGPERLGWVSGLGWAVGYVGGLFSLVIVLGFLAADPASGLTLLGSAPAFGLDPAQHEGARVAGPLSALWLLVFAIPLFLFTPDRPRGMALADAVRTGLADLAATLRSVRAHRPAFRYLVAHMIYYDGLAALFVFGAVYAAGAFQWSTVELGLFGILLTVAGAAGALAGGALEDRVGPRLIIVASLVALLAASAVAVSIDRAHVLFVVPLAPGGGGLYGSDAEKIYLAVGLVIGACAGPLQSSSRTYLAQLAPADKLGQFFGLYALSGKVTSFLAPAAVAGVTALAASQRAGIAVILVFLGVGLALLLAAPRASAGAAP